MTSPFGEQSTVDDVLTGINLAGKRVLVTGTSAGLGIETARGLVANGAQVVGAVRRLDKAQAATEVVRAAAERSGGSFELVTLDLGSLASVRACADALLAEAEPFDVIIANAGLMATPRGKTTDGFETQFGTNHLGHFVLINRIAPLLRADGRVVMLSSAGHRYSNVNLDDPGFEDTEYTPFGAYGRSKTANILFAVEFDRRHRDRGIRATAVHPGGIRTELSRHMTAAELDALINPTNGSAPMKLKSVPQGAATSVWAGFVASADEIGARYCLDCHVAAIDDLSERGGVRSYALDAENAKALWAKSEDMVGERF